MTEHSALYPILSHIQVDLCHDFSISTSLRTSYYWHSTVWDVDCHEPMLRTEWMRIENVGKCQPWGRCFKAAR